MASSGNYTISWQAGLRAGQWRLRRRQLPGRARPFRYPFFWRFGNQRKLISTHTKLFHRPLSHDNAPAAAVLSGHPKNTLTFITSLQVSEDAAPLVEKEGDDNGVTVLDDIFVAASENGFMLRRGSEVTWTCIAPGAQVRLTW
jgi:hypothetical protein